MKEVFNGDIGQVTAFEPVDGQIQVTFDDRSVVYDLSELDELALAYAISVHKSQRSEYAAVVMSLLAQHYVMLQRNLVYTAITRARKLLVLVGTRKALAIAVKNDRVLRRFTNLRTRLARLCAQRNQPGPMTSLSAYECGWAMAWPALTPPEATGSARHDPGILDAPAPI
ncbi:MAG: ATP-dependent RecD-like DNA helicase [Dehalococcoidia bacterium]